MSAVERMAKETEAVKSGGEDGSVMALGPAELEEARRQAEERAERLEAQLRQERVYFEVERAARNLNLVDSEAAALFLAGRVEFDAEGRPQNVETLLAELAQAKPYLVAGGVVEADRIVPGGGTSAANPSRGAEAQGLTFTRAQIQDAAFYSAHRDAILRAYREGRIVE